MERPKPDEQEQHLCADKGYDYPETPAEMRARGYQEHILRRGLDTPVSARMIRIGIPRGVG